MVPYLLFTLHLFLQSGPGVRHFLLKLLSDFLQVFLSLGGQGFYRFPGKEQKNLPVYSRGTIFHLNMIYAWYFFFFQFSTEHIILYSTVNWYLNHTCFFCHFVGMASICLQHLNYLSIHIHCKTCLEVLTMPFSVALVFLSILFSRSLLPLLVQYSENKNTHIWNWILPLYTMISVR